MNVRAGLLVALVGALVVSTTPSLLSDEQKPFKGWELVPTGEAEPLDWGDLSSEVRECLIELITNDENSEVLPDPEDPTGLPLQTLAGNGNSNVGGRCTSKIVGLGFFHFPTLTVYIWEFEVWTMANGDKLFTKNAGTLVINPDWTLTLSGAKTVIGGTGRFEDAEGAVEFSGVEADGEALLTFKGSISTVGSTRRS